jgi:hypothetical protein
VFCQQPLHATLTTARFFTMANLGCSMFQLPCFSRASLQNASMLAQLSKARTAAETHFGCIALGLMEGALWAQTRARCTVVRRLQNVMARHVPTQVIHFLSQAASNQHGALEISLIQMVFLSPTNGFYANSKNGM